MSTIHIVGINGSMRHGYTRLALNVALQGAQELGVTTQLIDLSDYNLPFCSGSDEDDKHAGVIRLRRDVRAANGIILGTPEYHGSYSGVLKNALDLMGFDEFESKMVGVVGVSGGRMGAINAINSLQTISRSLHAWIIPEQAAIPSAESVFNADGTMKNSMLENRTKEVGRQVARFAFLHTSDRAMEFLREWEQAVINPGGSER